MPFRACFIVKIFAGFLCSFYFSFLIKNLTINSTWLNRCSHPSQFVRYQNLSRETNSRGLVLVGVMTHFGTIKTRAVAIHETWGRDIPGKLIFFAGRSANHTEVDLPLVVLPVADDVYPPQAKAMLMLKYVYENYGDSFRWFIRADDDVYIHSGNLGNLLISISESDDVLLGHPGIGTDDEKGKLGLEEQSNFCIGGTGIMMSRSVLKKLYPHLDHCIKNTATAHEDSEVGRCIRKFVGVQCPWGYETSEIFHQDYGDDQTAYHGDLDLIPFEKVVSLHPVKDAGYLFRLHHHFLSIKQRKKQNRLRQLKKHLKLTQKLLAASENLFKKPGAYFCHLEQCGEFHTAEEAGVHSKDLTLQTWAMFQDLQSFGVRQFSTPVETVRSSKAKTLQLVTEKAKLGIIEEEKPELYHGFYFGKCNVGYTRESPVRGNLYEVHFTVRMKHHIDGALRKFWQPRHVKFKNSYGSLISRTQHLKPENELINIVLPVSGTPNVFEDFLRNVKEILEKFHETLRVFVVFFRDVTSLDKKFNNIFESYRKKFGDFKFVLLEEEGKFNPQIALNAVLRHFTKHQLILFIQMDFIFNSDFLKRCRQNTKKKGLYFPLALKTRDKKNAYRSGRWEFENFSTFCAYSGDVMPVTATRSVNASSLLVEQFISREGHEVEIFRAPDPDLFVLDTSRPPCSTKGSRGCWDRFISTKALFDYIFEKKYLEDYL